MKKLMLFMLAAMLGIVAANAQITQGRIGTGDITIAGYTTTDVYGLDFDNDGTNLEFRIADFPGSPNLTNGYLTYDWTDGGNNIVNETGVWDYMAILASGVTVGSTSEFEGQGDGAFNTTNLTAGVHYMGFRILLSDGVHYGWAEYTVAENGDDFDLTWTKCYYNATVGEAIATGDEGGSTPTPTLGAFTVANGTETNSNIPFYGNFADDNYQRCQTIYPASILTDIVGRDIYAITYYPSTAAIAFSGTFELRLGISEASSFSGNAYDETTPLTTVYTGTFDCSSTEVTLTFDSPFTYTGGNLMVDFRQTVLSSSYRNFNFYGTTVSGASVYGKNANSVAAITPTTSNFMPKTTFMVPESCTAPSALEVTPTETTAAINWTENGSATAWQYKLGDGSWTTVTSNPYTITELTANTAYTVQVRSKCGDEDFSFAISETFRTNCGTEAFPYFEGFESYTAGTSSFPPCWTKAEGTSYVQENSSWTTYASQGTKALVISADATVVSPIINVAGSDVYVNFDLKRSSTSAGTLAVGIAASPALVAAAVYFDTIEPANTDYANYEYIFNNTLSLASGCLVFKQLNSTSNYSYFYLDSLTVSEPPACPKPTGLALDEATDRSLTLSWRENGSATTWEMKVNDGEWTEVRDNPYELTGLTANTEYAISVRAFCDPDTSDAVSGTFRTLCGFEAVPYSEDFEGISSGLPGCWEQVASNASRAKWDFTSSGHEGNGLNFNDYWAENSRLILPVVDCSSLTANGQLSFYFKNPAISNGMFAHLVLYYRTSSTGEWVALDGWTLTSATEDWTLADVVLPESANAPYYQISFLATGENTTSRVYLYIDDIVIGEAPNCVRPSNLTAAATENSLELSWTENGTASKWVVKVNDGDWATVTENPYTLTGLTANTEYSVSVRSFCDPDTSEAFSATFRTACAAEVVTTDDSFEEEFEGITSGIPTCWAQTDGTWESYTTGNTGRGLYFSDYYSGEDTLITPEFNFAALNNGAQLSFWYKMPEEESYWGDETYIATLEVLYRTSTSGEWTVVETLTEAVEDWTEYDIVLPSSTNAASYQIAFRAVSDAGYTSTDVYLDKVVVTVPPACPKPSALTLDAATETSLTVSWTENGSTTKWVVKVDDGTWTETTQNPYTIDGLTANTEYAVTVRSFCNPDTSDAVSGTFRTACGIETLPFAERFEGTIDCWEQEEIAGTNTWVLNDSYYTAYEGSHYVALTSGYNKERRLISPVIDLTGAENVTLAFAHAQATWGSDQDSLKVEYRLSETDEWHVLATYTTAISSWQVENLSIDQTSATFQFAFHGYSNYGHPIAIDSVVLSGSGAVATCDVPTALAAGNVTANSAVITWNGTAAQYEVEFNGQSSTVTTNSYNATGLTAATDYAVRVRALCDGGLTSDWTAMVNFTTLDNGGEQPGDCGVPTNVAVSNVTTNSAVVTWDAPVESETFEGEWNLVMGQNDSVHTTITLNQTLHTILGMLGQDIADVDENVSVAGTQVPVTIEQGAGNQMNISGNFDMMMYGVDEPVTFHFNTTGTVTENGMNIEPANISESVAIMGTMNIDYTGTVTFEQPTELPEGGVLTIGIASMNITGYGDTVIMGQTGTVNISMTASDIEAAGMRAGAGNSEPTYEVMITNTASGVENTYASATRIYNATGLTAATAYTAKVRTVCGEGNYSEWSAAVPFTTLDNGDTPVECDVPTNVATSNVTATSVTVSWTGTASEYQIEVSDGGATPITITVSASPYTVEGLTAATNYTVRVRALCEDDETSDWSASAGFTTLDGGEPGPQGIDDVNASYSVSVYPNPATNNVTVSVDGLTGKAQVSVIDMSGRTVMTSTMESDATQLNVSKLAQGTYFVRINGENISTVHKLVVK